MDVIANNISNVNTTGFKSQRALFTDAFYQTLQGATGPNADTGRTGRSPQQIGLGSNLGSLDNIMTQGASMRTDNPLDLSINGDGFFVVDTGAGNAFTRAGNVAMDRDLNLHINGMQLMGWDTRVENGRHVVDRSTLIPLSMGGDKQNAPAEPTTMLNIIGNLDRDMLDGEGPPPYLTRQVNLYDSLGNIYTADVRFFFHAGESSASQSPHSYWTFEFLGPDNPTGEEVGSVVIYRDGNRDDPDARATVLLNANGSISEASNIPELRGDVSSAQGRRGTIAFDSAGNFLGVGNVVSRTETIDGVTRITYHPIRFSAANAAPPPDQPRPPVPPAAVPPNADLPTNPRTGRWFKPTDDDPWIMQIVPNRDVNSAASLGDNGGGTFGYDNAVGSQVNLTQIGRITMDASRLTAMAGGSRLRLDAVDGNIPGTLVDISVGNDGTIMGRYSNGALRILGQVPLAQFDNPSGLERAGASLWLESANSGRFDGLGDIGAMQGGALEMSNVDLGQQFTDMIVTQRGFQAASRTISVSDELLQELVNLRR
jgi:flagellar hook protein FlgE